MINLIEGARIIPLEHIMIISKRSLPGTMKGWTFTAREVMRLIKNSGAEKVRHLLKMFKMFTYLGDTVQKVNMNYTSSGPLNV